MVWPIFSACCRSRLGTLDGAAGAATALLTGTAATRGATSTTPATSVRRRLITCEPPEEPPRPGGNPKYAAVVPDTAGWGVCREYLGSARLVGPGVGSN